MPMRLLFLLLLLPTLLLLGGCAALSGRDMSTLAQQSDHFSEAMRWKDFPSASRLVAPEQRPLFLEYFKEDKDLQIVDSQIQSVDFDAAQQQALILYQLSYYRLPSPRIESWTWEQLWRRQPGKTSSGALWLIENTPPPLPWTN